MSLFRGIDYENLKDGEYIQFFGVHMLSWGDIERAMGIKPTIAFIEDDTIEKQNADLVAVVAETKLFLDDIYADDIVSTGDLSQLYEKVEQALAQVEGDQS